MQVRFNYIVCAQWKAPKITPLTQKQMGHLILITFYIDGLGGGAVLLTSVASVIIRREC